jgi:hypothetical protein
MAPSVTAILPAARLPDHARGESQRRHGALPGRRCRNPDLTAYARIVYLFDGPPTRRPSARSARAVDGGRKRPACSRHLLAAVPRGRWDVRRVNRRASEASMGSKAEKRAGFPRSIASPHI